MPEGDLLFVIKIFKMIEQVMEEDSQPIKEDQELFDELQEVEKDAHSIKEEEELSEMVTLVECEIVYVKCVPIF